MPNTYRALLHGDRLEWRGEEPEKLPPDRGVEVVVTILGNSGSSAAARTRGAAMAAALEQLAAAGGPRSFGDAAEWERETRGERVSPATHCRERASGFAVSYVEVLGYHRLSDSERRHFEAFFTEAQILPLSQPVLDAAVRLRRAKKIKLGDSLVAGTALLYDLTLITRNVDDFIGIDGLTALNLFAEL